ncbi:MAG: 4Fe-4S binding protein [Nitrososphaerota archaeon]|jgi:ferredoxin|nr:4Fe-4S binding protein [Nitrososphaerota archaeon]
MSWELPSHIMLPIFAVIALAGIYLIIKLSTNKTRKISRLRFFIQVISLVAIFMGLILGPFNLPQWQPIGPSPRSLLLGTDFLSNEFPDGFTFPVFACYYSHGRTVTCALWQLQAYLFPYWDYSNGYDAIYSTSGLEKIGIVVVSLLIASIVLGKFFCGWICPFGLYMDILSQIRIFARLRHLQLSEKTNTKLAQSRYLILVVVLLLSVIFASGAIFGTELIAGTTPAGPAGQTGFGGSLNQPFCLVCPMRPLCVLVESGLGLINFEHISKIFYGPYWMAGYYITSINLTILIIVTVLSLVYRRFWCRICPLGGLTALLSTFTPFKQIAMTRLKKNPTKCTKCGICKRACPTQATAVYEKKGGDVTESRCILCARCIEVCPYDDAIKLTFLDVPIIKSRNWLE